MFDSGLLHQFDIVVFLFSLFQSPFGECVLVDDDVSLVHTVGYVLRLCSKTEIKVLEQKFNQIEINKASTPLISAIQRDTTILDTSQGEKVAARPPRSQRSEQKQN
jgi:hypothetical protein